MDYQFSPEWASSADQQDVLKDFRDRFLFPLHDGTEVAYFCGNSLGLQPRAAAARMMEEMEDWARYGVEGHFMAKRPWFSYHENFSENMAKIVGAKASEIVMMNGLTVNLHLMMVSFYRPTASKYKILMEAKAFPSDQYAVESQVKFHGYDPQDAIIEISPREGEILIRNEDILKAIQENADSLALVFIGGVNYYSGQVFDMKTITAEAHKHDIIAGFDLAHAAGNVLLQLHDWDVDFAAWCSYKYLNSGPGSVAGVFVHERHGNDPELLRFAGWWGHDKKTRFKMEKGFIPMSGAEGWQLSNAPVFSMVALSVSLEIYAEAGMERLRNKSEQLTAYLEFILNEANKKWTSAGKPFKIISPLDSEKRGCQLSIVFSSEGKKVFDTLTSQGVISDWREPDVIRLAPVPLYNSFSDVYRFGKILIDLA